MINGCVEYGLVDIYSYIYMQLYYFNCSDKISKVWQLNEMIVRLLVSTFSSLTIISTLSYP